MTKIWWKAATLAATAMVTLLLPTPAHAHSDLIASTPADKSTITSAPTEIVLTFSGPVKSQFVTVAVTGPGGAYQTGTPQVVDGVVTQPLQALYSGVYTVAYRVVAADGHPITGAISFTADLPGRPAPTSLTEPSPADTPGSAGAASGPGLSGRLLIAGAVVLVFAVAGAVIWWRKRPLG